MMKLGEMSEDPQTNDEPDLSVLSMLSGAALVQPIAPFLQSLEFEATLSEVNTLVTNAPTGWTQPAMPETGNPAQVNESASETSSKLAALVDQSETVVTPAGVVLAKSSSQGTSSFTQELANQITHTAEVAEAESSPTVPVSNESEPTLQPKAETPVGKLKLVAQPATINAPQPTSEVQAAAPTALQLPDVPALHQIVEKVSLITKQVSKSSFDF
jgi:hypothetical protein